MIAAGILRFLYAYLFTQLFLARFFTITDLDLRLNVSAAFTTLSTIPPASPAIAGPIRAGPGTPPLDQPTQAQTQAAGMVASLVLVRKLSDRLLIELDMGLQPSFHTIYCGGDRYRTDPREVFGGGAVS